MEIVLSTAPINLQKNFFLLEGIARLNANILLPLYYFHVSM